VVYVHAIESSKVYIDALTRGRLLYSVILLLNGLILHPSSHYKHISTLPFILVWHQAGMMQTDIPVHCVSGLNPASIRYTCFEITHIEETLIHP
jgi:hypothetical protein